MVSFDSDHSGGDGASLFFLPGQFLLPLLFFLLGVSEKYFFGDLAD